MQKKSLILWAIYVFLISIIIGGCADIQNKAATKNEKYPDKPITVIVPFSVGSSLDMTARSLEKMAPKYLGQPLVVINKPGGAGAIGWNELAGANPDGYTIGITCPDMLLLPQYGATKYHYLSALSPIAQVVTLPMVIAVQADQPWQTLNDLIEYARMHPGQLKFGHSGVGTLAHVLGEMFGQVTGITIEQVPFSGSGESTTALLGGHIQLLFVNPMVVKEHVKNGTLRVLAVTSKQQTFDPLLAQIPTFKEQGIDITLNNWFGIATPKEMPIEVKNRLAVGFKSMITDPEFIENIGNAGLPVEYLDPKESEAKWLADSRKLADTLQETGLLERIKSQKK